MAVKQTFIDTLFVVALINRRDTYNAQAVELASLYDGQPLLTTDAVLLEIGNALARAFKPEAAEVIESFLTSQDVQVVRLTPALFEKAFALYQFIVMHEAGASDALTFDRHFAQAGFQALMRGIAL